MDLGANFITIITNDAWWFDTPGHRHLLSYARLSSIENRRFLIRSANSGVSAIINEIGEYKTMLPFDEKGIISGSAHTINKRTFYSRNGDYIARLSILISVLLLSKKFTTLGESQALELLVTVIT